MLRTTTTVFVSAFLGLLLLLLGAGGKALAGSDPPPHPSLDDCQAVWDDGSAKDTCQDLTRSTGPGKCIMRAHCAAAPRYAMDGYNETSFPRDGCTFVGTDTSGGVTNRFFKFTCWTGVEFSPDNTDSLSNCDGQLRRGSSC